MGNCKSALDIFALSKDERWQSVLSLFCLDRGSSMVADFQELVICPSRQGAHVVRCKDEELLFKIKNLCSIDKDYARFDMVELNASGRSTSVAVATLEKARAETSAKQGMFTMMEAWHLSSNDTETKERRTMMSRQKARKVRTPVAAASLNMHMLVTGKRDPTRGRTAETWTADFKVSDPAYEVKLYGESHTSHAEMKSVLIYHEGKLVCTGHLQTFAHLYRSGHERPFIGIQLKADSLRPKRAGAVSHSGPLKTLKSSSSNLDLAPSTQTTHEEILPLLLVLAWGEEAVHPPHDLRKHFIGRMRAEDGDSSRATTDIGWDAISAMPDDKQARGAGQATAADAELADLEHVRMDVDWELQAPMPPDHGISTQKTKKIPTAVLKGDRDKTGLAKAYSLSGI